MIGQYSTRLYIANVCGIKVPLSICGFRILVGRSKASFITTYAPEMKLLYLDCIRWNSADSFFSSQPRKMTRVRHNSKYHKTFITSMVSAMRRYSKYHKNFSTNIASAVYLTPLQIPVCRTENDSLISVSSKAWRQSWTYDASYIEIIKKSRRWCD